MLTNAIYFKARLAAALRPEGHQGRARFHVTPARRSNVQMMKRQRPHNFKDFGDKASWNCPMKITNCP